MKAKATFSIQLHVDVSINQYEKWDIQHIRDEVRIIAIKRIHELLSGKTGFSVSEPITLQYTIMEDDVLYSSTKKSATPPPTKE